MTTPAIQNRMVAQQTAAVTPMAAVSGTDTSIRFQPQVVPIYGYAGDTLAVRITVSDPALIAGGVITAQVRQKRTSEAVTATFAVTLESSTSFLLTLAADDTEALQGFKGEYDVQCTQPGTPPLVRTFVQGLISFDPDVTRP